MSDECNGSAPHICTGHFEDGKPCTAPAYIGFGLAPRCVQKGCVNYDAGLWCEWVMKTPDVPMPKDAERDFFDDEDTDPQLFLPNVGTGPDPALDSWGVLLGVPRKPGEDDMAYAARLIDSWGRVQP